MYQHLLIATDGLELAGKAVDHHACPLSSGAMVKYAWLNKELGHDASDAGRSVA